LQATLSRHVNAEAFALVLRKSAQRCGTSAAFDSHRVTRVTCVSPIDASFVFIAENSRALHRWNLWSAFYDAINALDLESDHHTLTGVHRFQNFLIGLFVGHSVAAVND